MVAVEIDLALKSSRQLETVQEHVTRIAVAGLALTLARVLLTLARVIGSPAVQFDPMQLKGTGILVPVPGIATPRIVIEHGFTSWLDRNGFTAAKTDEVIM